MVNVMCKTKNKESIKYLAIDTMWLTVYGKEELKAKKHDITGNRRV
ncbi:hypothetical protein [Candidatus Enterovibrio altilux]|uniref:Mobile element protein n=1 Tax=Candidatus Enterovibrio altilux TaxID=1927128 RepID=A0A291B7Y6_9GAMM|nr:hypothetical protein BTN50_0589 [Candidatus Enterovibrio luxaltus]